MNVNKSIGRIKYLLKQFFKIKNSYKGQFASKQFETLVENKTKTWVKIGYFYTPQ